MQWPLREGNSFQLHLHLMSCKPQPVVSLSKKEATKQAFGPVTHFASCQDLIRWVRKYRDAGGDGREEYGTEVHQ